MAAENSTLETDFDPLFTRQQVFDIEAGYNDTWGERRRITMMLMSQTKAQLLEGFSEPNGPDVLLDMFDHIREFRDHAKACLEMAESACSRILIVASIIDSATSVGE